MERALQHVNQLLAAKEQEFEVWRTTTLAGAGTAPMFKTYSASFIEVSLPEFTRFPVDYQQAIHEFRNQLYLLNQDVEAEQKRFWMSFDYGVEPHNQEILRMGSENAEKGLEYRFERVAKCLSVLIEHALAKAV